MTLYGTKCANSPHPIWYSEVLGDIYRELIKEYGFHQLLKPTPGHEYRKMYKPKSQIDQYQFRKLPELITVTSPPRLFRSSGWKYHGRVYLDCECYWTFDYKYPWDQGFKYDDMPLRLLTTCYQNATCTSNTISEASKRGRQLQLF